MKKQAEDLEETEKEIKRVDLKLITGGKEPPNGDTWLDKLDIGTVFLVKAMGVQQPLGLFWLMGRTQKSVCLKTPSVQDKIYYDPNDFCRQFRMHENLGSIEELTKEEADERNRELMDAIAEGEEMERSPDGEGK